MNNYFLYIITCGLQSKIGISNNPEKRLKQIATYCPIQPEIYALYGPVTQSQAAEAESFLHYMYGNKKTYREWFSLSIFDVNYIDQKLSGGIFEPHGYWKEMREIAVKLTEIFFNKDVVING